MNAVLFCHPDFLGSTSMPLFAGHIVSGLRESGVDVKVWKPKPFFYRLPFPTGFKKWLGYLDQFVVFPMIARSRLRQLPADTIFIYADQALGPWVSLAEGRPHAVHCHDFLALRSSLGEIPQNPVSRTGKVYQSWIRRGFNKGKNFICVSHRSSQDLQRFLDTPSSASIDVVHNGLDQRFSPLGQSEAFQLLAGAAVRSIENGFVLHVGGNQWYKNREGVLSIYSEYVKEATCPLPLLMVGAPPSARLEAAASAIAPPGKVMFVVRPDTEVVRAAYSSAAALIFPSIAEGFGWPIIEAMACGCPVLTTNEAPMTEAGGDAATYLPVFDPSAEADWARQCALILVSVLARDSDARDKCRREGLSHAARFNSQTVMRRYLGIYRSILEKYRV